LSLRSTPIAEAIGSQQTDKRAGARNPENRLEGEGRAARTSLRVAMCSAARQIDAGAAIGRRRGASDVGARKNGA
jgi:hypothetical protein